jgi:hypothetical protein
VNLSPTAQTVSALRGNVTVNGGTGITTLNIDDQHDTADASWVISRNAVTTSQAAGPVSYSRLSVLNVNGGKGKNHILVSGTGAATTFDTGYGNDDVGVLATTEPLTITSTATKPRAGQAVDTVLIGSADSHLNALPGGGGSLQGLFGDVTVSNPAGSTSLTLDDTADTKTINYTLTSGSLDNDSFGAAAAIHFGTGVISLEVRGGRGANTFHVLSTGRPTTLDAGSGTTAVTVGDASHNLKDFGALTVHGNGSTALTVDDRGNKIVSTVSSPYVPLLTQYTVVDQVLTRQAFAQVSGLTGPQRFDMSVVYSGLSGLTIDGGPVGTYLYQIDSTGGAAGVTVNAGGQDLVIVGDAQHNLKDVASVRVNGNGSTTLAVDDRNTRGLSFVHDHVAFTLQPGELKRTDRVGPFVPGGSARVYTTDVHFGGLQALTVYGGDSGNTFNVAGAPSGTQVTLNAGTGADTVTVTETTAALVPLADGLTVNGGGNTTLTLDDRGLVAAQDGRGDLFNPLANAYEIDPGLVKRNSTYRLVLLVRQPLLRTSEADIHYTNLSGLTVYDGTNTPAGPNAFKVFGTGQARQVTLNADNPGDAVTLGDAAHSLNNVTAVTVNGNGSTTLAVDDRNIDGLSFLHDNVTFTLQPGELKRTDRLGLPTPDPKDPVFTTDVLFGRVKALTVYGGAFSNTFNVAGAPSGTQVTLNAGAGADSVTVSEDIRALAPLADGLTVHGGGNTTLTLDDRGLVAATAPRGLTYVPLTNAYEIDPGLVKRNSTYVVFPLSIGGRRASEADIHYTNLARLVVDGGAAGNVFDVRGTTAGTTTTVNGGSGGSTVNLSPTAHNLADLAGLVSVNGQGGTNTLNVFDQATTFAPAPGAGDTLYQDHLTRTDPGARTVFTYGGVQSVNVSAGRGDNGFEIFGIVSTPAGVPVTVTDASPTSQVEFFAGSPLDFLQGPLNVVGRAGAQDLLLLNDAANASPQAYTVTANTVSRPGMATVTYANLTQMILYTSNTGAHAAVTVQGTAAATFTQVLLLTAGDQATVNAPGVQGALRILSNGAGPVPVSVTVDDSSDRGSRTATFSTDPTYRYLLDGLTPGRIYLDVDPGSSVQVQGGSGGNAFNVQSTPAGVNLTVNAGAGTDGVNVGSAANSLDAIRSALTVNGRGNTTLNLNDQGSAVREEYDVYSGKITRELLTFSATTPTQTINYSGLTSITVNGASPGDYFFALGTPAGTALTFNGGGTGGGNFFFAYDDDAGDSLQGPVTFHGHNVYDNAEVYDYGNAAGRTYDLSAAGATSTMRRSGAADVTYDGVGQMILYTPLVGGDHLNVRSVAPGVFENLSLSNGDVAVVGSQAPGLGGTTANVLRSVAFTDYAGATSTLTVDDSGNTSTAARRVTVAPPPSNPNNIGSSVIGLLGASAEGVYWRLNPGSSVALRGGAGDETFALTGALPNVKLSIDGGGGVNTLDYSGWTGAVTVILQQGTATGLDGGIANIRNVTGSVGNDLLVGDANTNVLVGGTGRNIIIGGGGADRITGGGGDNLLIGGTTDYDQNAAALDLIFREWLLASDFATRVAALQSGSDLLAGSGIRLVNGTTVHPDGQANVTPGPGNNWVIA